MLLRDVSFPAPVVSDVDLSQTSVGSAVSVTIKVLELFFFLKQLMCSHTRMDLDSEVRFRSQFTMQKKTLEC